MSASVHPQVVTGVFTLAGAVVGWAGQQVTQRGTERRRERRDGRVARQLVYAELLAAAARYTGAIAGRVWWSAANAPVTTDWREHRGALLLYLDGETGVLTDVVRAYGLIEYEAAEAKHGELLEGVYLESLQTNLELIEKAIKGLAALRRK